ncbi:unnamed protein product [Acanthosepion pharaonis]|uniref:Uncharacterized protein n=1 Tax=Acanthosepion pharaonis TaxID=158019 RepID=A0A812B108_ACAPH|nr:unnamed protein product [Sepia pharaonis]
MYLLILSFIPSNINKIIIPLLPTFSLFPLFTPTPTIYTPFKSKVVFFLVSLLLSLLVLFCLRHICFVFLIFPISPALFFFSSSCLRTFSSTSFIYSFQYLTFSFTSHLFLSSPVLCTVSFSFFAPLIPYFLLLYIPNFVVLPSAFFTILFLLALLYFFWPFLSFLTFFSFLSFIHFSLFFLPFSLFLFAFLSFFFSFVISIFLSFFLLLLLSSELPAFHSIYPRIFSLSISLLILFFEIFFLCFSTSFFFFPYFSILFFFLGPSFFHSWLCHFSFFFIFAFFLPYLSLYLFCPFFFFHFLTFLLSFFPFLLFSFTLHLSFYLPTNLFFINTYLNLSSVIFHTFFPPLSPTPLHFFFSSTINSSTNHYHHSIHCRSRQILDRIY